VTTIIAYQGDPTLSGVEPGDTITLTVDGVDYEVIVHSIDRTPTGDVERITIKGENA